ncbi:unnamed protein product [Brachionus calyciflorus]|uniref:Uncharacterized protein n=1 Tax=Brachionus calyciflorus TaxID=104777 RepID=A0A814NKD0_9BILA|nr:unnamed protein product [Brachionus calyciflorus]
MKETTKFKPKFNDSPDEFSLSKSSTRSLQAIDESPESFHHKSNKKFNSRLPPLSPSHKKISNKFTKNLRNKSKMTSSSMSDELGDSFKGDFKNNDTIFKSFDSPINDEISDLSEEDETFEEHVQKILKTTNRTHTPLFESIWPKDILNARNHDEKNDTSKKINFKFGSSLSEDGRYAMLKAYEDMIYYDLLSMNPERHLKNTLERTKTEVFKQIPKKSCDVKLPNIKDKANNVDNLMSDENKKKFNCSKELEKAMKIYDGIKKFKGEIITTQNYYKKDQLLPAYKAWKANCYYKI